MLGKRRTRKMLFANVVHMVFPYRPHTIFDVTRLGFLSFSFNCCWFFESFVIVFVVDHIIIKCIQIAQSVFNESEYCFHIVDVSHSFYVSSKPLSTIEWVFSSDFAFFFLFISIHSFNLYLVHLLNWMWVKLDKRTRRRSIWIFIERIKKLR